LSASRNTGNSFIQSSAIAVVPGSAREEDGQYEWHHDRRIARRQFANRNHLISLEEKDASVTLNPEIGIDPDGVG
jgi:hypothetical protein